MDLAFCYEVRQGSTLPCELEVVTPQRTWRLVAPDARSDWPLLVLELLKRS